MSDPNPPLELRTNPGGDATLTSLAYLNVTWEDSRTSYFDNFVPFALEILRTHSGRLTVHKIAEEIRSRFGLDFPRGVVSSIVGRAARRRLVARTADDGVELVTGVAETLPDLSAKQADYRRRQNHLVDKLVAFAGERFALTWSVADAESALVEYIEAHLIPLLGLAVSGRNYADDAGQAQGRGYVVAAYVVAINESDPTAFDYLDQMIKGSMLASALYIDAPSDTQRRFRNTTLYLDTAICLRALGHEGPDARAAVQQLLSLCAAQGARLACYEHSVNEMRGILDGAKVALRSTPGAETATRGVATFFRDAGFTTSDIDLAVQRLERDLRANKITVESTPAYTNELGLDELSLEDVLQERVGYKRDAARVSDLKSLTAIHRYRGGESGPHLETCRAVLITNNPFLVRAARDFFDSGRHEWPVAMLDHDLAALVWIKEPATAPDLPRRQIIADCYSAMAPSAAMWSRMVEEIERLGSRGGVSAEDITLLRYSHEAERSMQDLTFGDPRRVSEATILKALALARAASAAPAEERRAAAIDRAVSAEAEQAVQAVELEHRRRENDDLRRRLTDLESRETQREVAVRERLAARFRLLHLVSSGVLIVVLVGVITSGLISLFPVVSANLPTLAAWLLRGFALLGVIASGLILYFGKSLREWHALKIEAWRARSEQGALRRAGLVADAADEA